MTNQRRLELLFGPSGEVAHTRTVRDLDAALNLIRRLGGTVASEVRTAPGIGSWAFVSDTAGTELVLWQSAALVPS